MSKTQASSHFLFSSDNDLTLSKSTTLSSAELFTGAMPRKFMEQGYLALGEVCIYLAIQYQIERNCLTTTAWGPDSCNKVGKCKSGEIPIGRQNVKLKIGVMGSATGTLSKTHKKIAYELGLAIAQSDCVTITGACPGLPLESAKGAHEAGGIVIGISPALSEWEHVSKYGSPLKYHDVLIFTGSGLMGREVVNIRSSDVVVIIGGRSGTLGEFSIAYDEGKLIGVLIGTGGITAEIKHIVKIIKKRTGARIIYGRDPRILVKELLDYYITEHHKHPSVHHDYTKSSAIGDS